MPMQARCIKAFTLLEVMIVIGLLSVVGSFFTLRIASYIQERTYDVEEEVIDARFQLAKRVKALCDCPVTLELTDNALTTTMSNRTPEGLQKVLKRPLPLKRNHQNRTTSTTQKGPIPPYPDEVETPLPTR